MKHIQQITKTITLLVSAGLLLTLPVLAHHSTVAFINDQVIKIEGKVTQFRWINPHASFKVDGVTADGPDGLWTVEMTAPNVLIKQGWRRNSIRKGDKVTVFVNPLRNAITLKDGSQGGLYIGIILADGSTLGQVDGKSAGTVR